MGHLYAAKLLGYNIDSIRIVSVGINGQLKEEILNNSDIFIIAIAGPLVNLILALCTCRMHMSYICLSNIYMLLLNLLPIPPLDGYKICNSFFQCNFYEKIISLAGYLVVIATAYIDYVNNSKINIMLICIILFTLSDKKLHCIKKVKTAEVSADSKIYELLKIKSEVFIIYEEKKVIGILNYEDVYNAAFDGLYFINTKELFAERIKNGYQRT